MVARRLSTGCLTLSPRFRTLFSILNERASTGWPISSMCLDRSLQPASVDRSNSNKFSNPGRTTTRRQTCKTCSSSTQGRRSRSTTVRRSRSTTGRCNRSTADSPSRSTADSPRRSTADSRSRSRSRSRSTGRRSRNRVRQTATRLLPTAYRVAPTRQTHHSL